MKIVFLAPFGIRPKGTVIARMIPLAVELKKLDHDVVIVAPPYGNPEDSGKVETVAGVTIRNIVLGPKNRVLAAPFMVSRLLRATLAERPDLIHLFKPKGYGGLALMLLVMSQRLGKGSPLLVLDADDWEGRGGMNDLHEYSPCEKRLYEFQERWLPPRVCGATVASRLLEELYLSLGVARERLLYLPNCVYEKEGGDGGRIRNKLGIPQEAPVVLLYTRFFEFDQERLYEILSAIYQKLTNVRFLVVGKGRHGEEKRLADYALNNGFADSVVAAGWVEPALLPDYLAAGDVAIYPFSDTLVNRAKCPAKLTELLSSGVPVVADRVGQIPQYVAPDLDLFLTSPANGVEMALKCLELLADGDKRMRASKIGREYILANFSWREYTGELIDFYTGIVAGDSRKCQGGS